MSLDTRPAPLDGSVAPSALDDYRLTQAPEILRWLNQLRDGAVPVVLNGPDGQSYTSTLWTLDSSTQRLSFSADEHHVQLQRLVDSDEIVAVAYVESVKLQFELRQPVLIRGGQGCALQARMPKEMFRFQRRSSYRVRTQERHGPVAQFRHPSMPEMLLNLRILDVSIGGCALRLPQDVPPLQPGTRLQQVRIELDADTRFHAGIVLQHVAGQSGSEGTRLGCEWQQMDAGAQRGLQRFIDSSQKRRRFLSLS